MSKAKKKPAAPAVEIAGSRDVAVIAAGCALLHILLGLALHTPVPYHGGDNATYISLAKSLLEHGRYLELWDPLQRAATLYPPLFPISLAGALALGLESWSQLKIVTLIISAAAVGLSVLWLGRRSRRNVVLVGGILLAVSPGILEQAGFVLSEGLFWLFTMLGLWAVSHLDEGDARPRRWLVITAVAAAAAALTRSAGLPLIVAVAAALMLERRWRDSLLFAVIAVPPLMLWSLRARLVGARGYGSYLTMKDPYDPALGAIGIPEFLERILVNVSTYIGTMAPALIWGTEAALRPLLIALLVIAFGWWLVRLVRQPDVVAIWLLLYAGLVLIWPETWAGERFVLPMVPVLVFFAGDLLDALRHRNPDAAKAAVLLTVALAFVAIPPVLIGRLSRAHDCRQQAAAGDAFTCMPSGYGDFMRVADASRTALPANSIVLSRKPTLFFAQSGLRSMMYPLSADTARFFAAADSVGARYLVLDQVSTLAEKYLNPIVSGASEHFCVETALTRNQAVLMRILEVPRAHIDTVSAEGYIAIPDCAGQP